MRLAIARAGFPAAKWSIPQLTLGCGIGLFSLWIALSTAGQTTELAYADAFFKQKEYEKAAQHYGWLINKYRRGPRVGMASYRLGTINLNAKDYAAATVNFELASREADSPEIRYQAKYFNARCLQLIKKEDLALSLYDQLIRSNPGPATNHFLEKSILETARIHAARGENEKAQQHFQTLIDSATTDTVREEAVVRSGLASVESGEIEQGEHTLKQAGKFRKDSPWKSLAEVGALSVAYAKKDYDRVVSIYSSGTIISTAGEYRPKVLVMVADAFRARGDNKGAARLYTLVEGRYPNTESGVEAGYRKLTLIYKSNNGTLPIEVEKYATKLRSRDVNHVYIDKAYLLLAEWHFFQAEKGIQRKDREYATEQYRLAGETYQKIREENISTGLVPTMLFHHSWASLEAGDVIPGAQSVTDLMERFPESNFVPAALAKRGETYLDKEAFNSAMSDFQVIIANYPDSPFLELALERQGRIYAHKRMLPEMVASYEGLLNLFPESESTAEACFWVGDGYFEQKKYRDALPYFKKARKLDPDSYANKTGIRIILCHHSLKQVPETADAARIYIQSGRDAGVLNANQKKDQPLKIPNHVLIHLGEKLTEKKQFADAELFLKQIVTPDEPGKNDAKVWKLWARIKLNLKDYEAAITAFDHFLVQTGNLSERGYSYLHRGRAQFALEQYDRALISARECLRVVKQGRINADARMLIGDIAIHGGELEVAAQEYYIVSQIFDDPFLTPHALRKAVQLNQKMGNHGEATRLEKILTLRMATSNQ